MGMAGASELKCGGVQLACVHAGVGEKWVLTAAPLCSFLRNRCEVKTKNTYFCPYARFFLK